MLLAKVQILSAVQELIILNLGEGKFDFLVKVPGDSKFSYVQEPLQ